jgi:hypothetical protein
MATASLTPTPTCRVLATAQNSRFDSEPGRVYDLPARLIRPKPKRAACPAVEPPRARGFFFCQANRGRLIASSLTSEPHSGPPDGAERPGGYTRRPDGLKAASGDPRPSTGCLCRRPPEPDQHKPCYSFASAGTRNPARCLGRAAVVYPPVATVAPLGGYPRWGGLRAALFVWRR